MATGRKQFTFYESFAKAIKMIRSASDRCKAYEAIINYALYHQEPDSLPDHVSIIFELIRPTLDTSRKKSELGANGLKKRWNKE